MSIKVISWVWESSASRGVDRLVLLAIADSASGDDGTNAYPSVATLARKAGVSARTVQRSIRSLCESGELRMTAGAGRNGSNLYRVNMRQIDTPVSLSPPRQDDIRPDDTTPVNESRGGVSVSPTPRPVVTQSVLDPLGTKRESLSPFCSKHPKGTEAKCGNCKAARIRSEAQPVGPSAETMRKATTIRARLECSECDSNGLILDADHKPLSRCLHGIQLPEVDRLAAAR